MRNDSSELGSAIGNTLLPCNMREPPTLQCETQPRSSAGAQGPAHSNRHRIGSRKALYLERVAEEFETDLVPELANAQRSND